nr:hypothetical protein [uncultured Cohaesibacter sp.]
MTDLLRISFPSYSLVVTLILFSIARFENQRWKQARLNGFSGASQSFGGFVDLLAVISTVYFYLLLLAFAFDFGLVFSVSCFAATVISSILWALVFRCDNPLLWLIGTAAILPIGVWLSFSTSWFGLQP